MISKHFPLHKILREKNYIYRKISDKDKSSDIYLENAIL